MRLHMSAPVHWGWAIAYEKEGNRKGWNGKENLYEYYREGNCN